MDRLTVFGIWAFLIWGAVAVATGLYRSIKHWKTSVKHIVLFAIQVVVALGAYAILKNAYSGGAEAVES